MGTGMRGGGRRIGRGTIDGLQHRRVCERPWGGQVMSTTLYIEAESAMHASDSADRYLRLRYDIMGRSNQDPPRMPNAARPARRPRSKRRRQTPVGLLGGRSTLSTSAPHAFSPFRSLRALHIAFLRSLPALYPPHARCYTRGPRWWSFASASVRSLCLSASVTWAVCRRQFLPATD